jgi:hypothetical protein
MGGVEVLQKIDSLKMKKIKSNILVPIRLILIAGVLVSCGDNTDETSSGVVIIKGKDSAITQVIINSKSNSGSSSNHETDKLNAELAKEAIGAAVDLGKFVFSTIKINDSIKMANREKMFAYQIGLPMSDKSQVFEEYKKIHDSTGLFVMKVSRRDYYIVKYDGRSKEELEDNLDNFNALLSIDISGNAKVINLMSLCSKREKLMRGENLTKRKETIELPCLICDK